MKRAVGLATGSAVVAAALLFGSGTAIAAPDTVSPGASTASSAGGTGGEACSYLPSSLQELFCPSVGGEGEGEEASSNTGGAAAGGTSGSGSSATSSGATGGTTGGTGATGTTPTSGTSGSSASPPGVVSNFLIWLAGLFQYIGL